MWTGWKVALLGLLLSCASLALGGATDNSASSASAVVAVSVVVNPNIAISAVNSTVDMGTVQTGDVIGSLDFHIDANTEQVCICVVVSDLYKGGDPTATNPLTIPVNLTAGVVMQPEHANPVAGLSNIAAFTSDPGPVIQGYPTHVAEHFLWESSQNNEFSQNVNIKVTWTQNDPELPTGEYDGVVTVYCMAIPAGS